MLDWERLFSRYAGAGTTPVLPWKHYQLLRGAQGVGLSSWKNHGDMRKIVWIKAMFLCCRLAVGGESAKPWCLETKNLPISCNILSHMIVHVCVRLYSCINLRYKDQSIKINTALTATSLSLSHLYPVEHRICLHGHLLFYCLVVQLPKPWWQLCLVIGNKPRKSMIMIATLRHELQKAQDDIYTNGILSKTCHAFQWYHLL